MSFRRLALAAAAVLAFALPAAQAANVALPTDGSWVEFNVDGDLYRSLSLHDYNSDLPEAATFTFTVASGYRATLTVVDLGFSGDRFTLSDNGNGLGTTSAGEADVALGGAYFVSAASADQALANSAFSQGVYTLGAGSHAITGVLSTSLLDMNSTNGALKLSISPVPEPATVASLLAGLALLGAVSRRRSAR